jgi:hypothetical protein
VAFLHAVGLCVSKQPAIRDAALSLDSLEDDASLKASTGFGKVHDSARDPSTHKHQAGKQPKASSASSRSLRRLNSAGSGFFNSQSVCSPVKLLARGGTSVVWLCRRAPSQLWGTVIHFTHAARLVAQ